MYFENNVWSDKNILHLGFFFGVVSFLGPENQRLLAKFCFPVPIHDCVEFGRYFKQESLEIIFSYNCLFKCIKSLEFVCLSVMKLLHRHSQIVCNKIPHFFKMSCINHIQEIQCLGTTICMNNSWFHLFNM